MNFLKLFLLFFCFFLGSIAHAITKEGIFNSVGLDVVSEYREEDNPGEFFVGYKFKEKFPEFNIEIRNNYINIVWYEDPSNLENSENFELARSVLKYLLHDDSILASLKSNEQIKEKEINGYQVTTFPASEYLPMYMIKIDNVTYNK